MRKFLSAQWLNLILVNYEIDPFVLQGRLPSGTELDFDEDKCFISLVGFLFVNTRVFCIPVPFHTNFEEVNLRFYVRRVTGMETRRGVTFIKEIVPRRAITAVACLYYGEPYECWKMSHITDGNRFAYRWTRGDLTNSIAVETGENRGVPTDGSHERFIIEHYWGYTRRGRHRTDEYKVEHPSWALRSVETFAIDVDFGRTYGQEFAFLNHRDPYSVLFTEGSPIAVFAGSRMSDHL